MNTWRIKRWWTDNRPIIVRRKTLRLLREAVARADREAIRADRLHIELVQTKQNAITPRQAARLRRKLNNEKGGAE